jgi:hypothetical protein
MSTFDSFSNNSNKLFTGSQNTNIETVKTSPNTITPSKELLFVCCFDYGSRELGLNHLKSLKNQGIDNYMAFIADRSTYELVKKYGFKCTFIDDANFSTSQKTFGHPDFVEFSFLRYKFIHESLKTYKYVWYLDVDTVVLDNLNSIYGEYLGKGYDIVFQNDVHQIQNCTGCMLYFSNQKTLDMTAHVYKGMNRNIPDQHFVNYFLMQNPGVFKTTMFDLERFPNGLIYFDKPELIDLSIEFDNFKKNFYKNKDKTKKLAFVHANWMVGIDTKINAFKKKSLWYLSN